MFSNLCSYICALLLFKFSIVFTLQKHSTISPSINKPNQVCPMISCLFRQTTKPCAQKVEIGCVSDHVVTSFLGGDLLVNKSQGPRRTKGILLFFQKPERYNQEVLSHSFICLPLPYMEGIVFICNIDLYFVIAIFNGHR